MSRGTLYPNLRDCEAESEKLPSGFPARCLAALKYHLPFGMIQVEELAPLEQRQLCWKRLTEQKRKSGPGLTGKLAL